VGGAFRADNIFATFESARRKSYQVSCGLR
jgi:hypothetical protein